MQVRGISVIDSPERPGWVRLCAEVVYEDPSLASEVYWFEVREKYKSFLSDTGNPWLVCLAPLAMALGEPLKIVRPVDRTLLANVYERMRIWKCWYPRLTMIRIEAELLEHPIENAGKTCSFFSGGVDAFFTALYYDRTPDPLVRIPIEDLVNVWGFDIPLANAEAHEEIAKVFRRSAEDLGKELIEVATNLRETQLEKKINWEYLNVSPALASVALALEKRYKKALISSAGGYLVLCPDGTSALLDPLSSTQRLQVVHAGAAFSRVQKTEYIAPFEVVQRSLHVCFHIQSEKNCGRCIKCYRTMTTLETLGFLDRFQTFPKGAFHLSKLAKMFLWESDDVRMSKDVERLAVQKSREDVANAIRGAFKHTQHARRLLSMIKPLYHSPATRKLYWALEHKILADSIGGEERYYPIPDDSILAVDESVRFANNFK